jgi:hypothetical protein
MLVSTASRVLFVRRAAAEFVVHPNPLDDEYPVFHLDVALGLRRQVAFARLDLARLQRATQCSGQSTRGRGDDVIEGGGLRLVGARGCLVVLGDFVMHAEEHRFALGRKVGAP